MNLAGEEGCQGGTRTEQDKERDATTPTLRFIVPDGVVMGVDPEGQMIWKQKVCN